MPQYMKEADRKRNEGYGKYTKLFESAHKEVFTVEVMQMSPGDRKRYVTANLAALISKASADLLFGEAIKIKSDDDATLKNIAEIEKHSKLDTLLWEVALSTSYLGDGFLKARFDPNVGAIVEYVDPSLVTIETNPDNASEVLRFIIQWKRTISGKEYLRREVREKGVIKNELWTLGEKEGELGSMVDISVAYPVGGAPAPEQLTGVDGFLMVHIPNFKSSSNCIYGRSDYAELLSLFSEINNRITRDGAILDKHADPKLAVPPGVLDKDGKVRREAFNMFEVGASNAGIQKPEYITWDGNLEGSSKHFERVLKMVWLVSETSPDLFGLGENGPESGRALRLRLMRTLAKIGRKKRYFADSLKTLLEEATILQAQMPTFTVAKEFSLEFQDGLPTDYREDAEIREIEMRSGTVSLETAVRERNPEWTEEQVAEEVERIKGDNELVSATPTKIADFNPMNPPNPDMPPDEHGDNPGNNPQDMNMPGNKKPDMMMA